MKSIRTFTIASNEDSRDRVAVKLYRDNEGLVWRLAGPDGDECETLPRPTTIKQAEIDAQLIFRNREWTAAATWMR